MLFVDSNGRITHANAVGSAMIADGRVLHASLGRLLANDPDTSRALRDSFLTAANGDAAIGDRGVALPLVARDGERYVAHVLPLSSGARRGAGMSYAAVAVGRAIIAQLIEQHPDSSQRWQDLDWFDKRIAALTAAH
jgi:hypothetical protein